MTWRYSRGRGARARAGALEARLALQLALQTNTHAGAYTINALNYYTLYIDSGSTGIHV